MTMGNTQSEICTQEQIKFTVNGKLNIVGPEVGVETRLVRFIRDRLHMTGTKFSCGQGGCGACTVTVTARDPGSGLTKTRAVNSCLVPVLSCDGWEISTVESLGNKKDGFHPLQSRLAKFSGSQCGFCSPGMIMATNSLLHENESPNMKEIEHCLDGNICRCTGFRPILDAMKSFAGESEEVCKGDLCEDIEDLAGWVCPKKNALFCSDFEHGNILVRDKNKTWISPNSLETLFDSLEKIPETASYRLVAGNTGVGVYEDEIEIDFYIDISKIYALKRMSTKPFQVGGGVCLSDAMNKFEVMKESVEEDFWYLQQFCDQLKYVASSAIRDIGSIGGNLMLKHSHPEFQSDVFNLLEAVGAKITVSGLDSQKKIKTTDYLPSTWLQTDMEKKIILHITFPRIPNSHIFSYYKVTPRAAFAHAHVNAGFLAELDQESGSRIVSKPAFVFGGVSASFIHATKSETFVVGKDLKDPKVIKELFQILSKETDPDEEIDNSSREYRAGLVEALLYKFLLMALGVSVPTSKKNGTQDLRFLRPLQQGSQEYKTDPKMYPVNKPVEKLEATLQCSGEAEYINDIPALHNEVHAAMVVSTQANCDIESVDSSKAFSMQGVIDYIDHTDIPGLNTVTYDNEPLFAADHVAYAGQAVGLIVAESFEIAHKASRMVKINYKNKKIPILNIKDALNDEKRKSPVGDPIIEGDIDIEHGNAEKTVMGEFQTGGQYHFHLETQTSICKPIEDGFDVICATQDVDAVQKIIAKTLGIKESDINMTVRRLGGAFGGKISGPNIPAAACAVAANKLRRPVRLSMDLRSNMEMLGKRLPYLSTYKASLGANGKISAIEMKMYCNSGYNYNEATADGAALFAKNVYISKAWNISPNAVLTDTASNTWCRAPGSTQGHAIIENIVEHLAHEAGEDPLEFRIKNMIGEEKTNGKMHPIREIIEMLKKSSNFEKRKEDIETFNKKNIWQKKGIALIPLNYRHDYWGARYHVNISVYHDDGSVAVTHGAIEMGQGVNTKVCQVVARELDIPMDIIRIKPTNNFVNANGSVTGGSMGSESSCAAAVIACQNLKNQMKKVKDGMENPNWKELVKKCFMTGVDLTAHHMGQSTVDSLVGYNIWGAVVTEVQIDVLTGMMTIARCDLLEDTGMAISPEVDIGQVEGGLIMGLGLWTSEQLRYDPTTGRLVDNSTWHYKVPTCLDIPADLRIEFYDSGNNPNLVLGSKVTGEPCVLAGCSVLFALRMAITSARTDAGLTDWFQMDGPATVESIKMACAVTQDRLTLM